MIDITIKQRAEEAKIKLRCGVISYDEAVKEIMPFIKLANEYSKELAKKYNQRHRRISVQAYLR